MRAESSAICTSGEPVSFALRRYCVTIPPFCSVDNDICPIPLWGPLRPATCGSALMYGHFEEARIVLARARISTRISSKTTALRPRPGPCRGRPCPPVGPRAGGPERRSDEEPHRLDPPARLALHESQEPSPRPIGPQLSRRRRG